MTLWCKLLALAAGLPGLAAAADPEMMNLVMPDASVVMEVNIAKIMASPIGSAMGEAVHQGIAKQLKVELTKAKPQFQEQIAGLSAEGFQLRHPMETSSRQPLQSKSRSLKFRFNLQVYTSIPPFMP